MPESAKGVPPGGDYAESTDLKWTNEAFKLLDNGQLHGEIISSRGVVRSRVWGPCPRCGHNLDDRQTHTAVTSAFGGEWRGPAPDEAAGVDDATYYEVDVTCGCGPPGHRGAPEGRTGCGTSFRVELELQDGSGPS